MIRRLKRNSHFELTLDIKDNSFIATPRDSQRGWLLTRLVGEIDEELKHLDSIAPDFISGSDESISFDRAQGSLSDDDIMEDWQIPVMREMARFVTHNKGDVLEIGMGRGVASAFVQEFSPNSHTLVECNDTIAAKFPEWRQEYPASKITMIHGLWQHCTDQMGMYDGILFHTYPLSEQEFIDQVVNSVTFAEHFFPTASVHLRKGGLLTYLTNEIDSLSRAHQRSLLNYFSSFSVSMIEDLDIPDSTRDALWLNQMVLIQAFK